MNKLYEIKIINYKSIENVTIHFSDNKTVFVGKNNAGKSNILKVIKILLSGEYKNIKPYEFHNKDKKVVFEITFLKNNVDKILKKVTLKINNGKVEINEEKSYSGKDELDIDNFLENIDFIYIPTNRNFGDSNTSWYGKMIELIYKNKNENIENKKIIGDLKKIIISVIDIIERDRRGKDLDVDYLESKNEIYKDLGELIKYEEKKGLKDFDNLSLGTKNSLFLVLFDLYYKSLSKFRDNKLKIFIIDHVENFLHPHSIRLIDKVLQDISETENTQIIYTTHANELVSNFKKDKYEIDSIRFVYKLNSISRVKKIKNKYGNYEKIMINLMFKNTDVFFSDYIILVEGETEKISIPNIFEYWPWKKEDLEDCNLKICDNIIGNSKVKDFFNLSLKNIAIIDVGGKGALTDWYEFCSELLGKRNVFAIIDRDDNFYEDRGYIRKSIKKVHKVDCKESDFAKYNWIILDGEFENYYKAEKIKEYLEKILINRFKNNFQRKKEINYLIEKIQKLKINKKISVSYERLFKKYLRGFGKPTIAFNLSIWLTQNEGYDRKLIEIFKNIIYTIEKNKEIEERN